MDWSLINPYAKNPFLRDVLGYKHPFYYYLAMIVDPLLRFNWIPYALVPGELQHSAVLAFAISCSEILRRAIWSLFRVENEHCTNVGRFRASRDVPLPYDIPSEERLGATVEEGDEEGAQDVPALAPTEAESLAAADARRTATGTDLESALVNSNSPATMRRRKPLPPTPEATPMQRGIARVGTIIAAAHAQDFEKKRRPGVGDGDGRDEGRGGVESDDDDEEEEEEEDEEEVAGDEVEEEEEDERANRRDLGRVGEILERRRSAVGGGGGDGG